MTAHPSSAEELLSRAAGHDEAALAEIYDRLAPALLGIIIRIIPDRGRAENLLQDVFLRLWIDARRWSREQVSVPASLALMARAKAVEQLRQERHAQSGRNGKGDLHPKFHAWLPRPHEIDLLDGRRELFKKIINQLPAPQRQALDMVVFGGYTEIEIAEKLGEPLAKVRSGLIAGLGFIRHRLAAVMRTWAANI